MVAFRRSLLKSGHDYARVQDNTYSGTSQQSTEKNEKATPQQKPSIEQKESIFGAPNVNPPKEDADTLAAQLAASRDESKALKAEVSALKKELSALKGETNSQGSSVQATESKNQTGGGREADRMIREGGALGAALKDELITLKASLNSWDLEKVGDQGNSGEPLQSKKQDVESKERKLASKHEGPSGPASMKESSVPAKENRRVSLFFQKLKGKVKTSEATLDGAPSNEATSHKAISNEAPSNEALSNKELLNETLSSEKPLKEASPKKASFLELPTEIVTHVATCLPPESVISFAMTCRRYYLSYFPERPSLDDKSTEALLILLEKDVPSLVYCPECIILHSWRLQAFSNFGGGVYPYRMCQSSSSFMQPSCRRALDYGSARLLMNRHLYGSSHGLSLGMVGRVDKRRCQKTGLALEDIWRARIVDDELFLCITRKAHNPNGGMKALEKFLRDRSEQKICHHRTIWGALLRSPTDPAAAASLAQMVHECCLGPVSLPQFLADLPNGIVLSCPICLTDAEIKISWYGKAERWAVSIDTWIQLGACRSPSDLKWKGTKHNYSGSGARESEPMVHPAGAVRRRWATNDAEDLSDMKAYFLKK